MKVKCLDVQLTAFLLGELPKSETEIFREHLDECSKCQAEMASLREVIESYSLSNELPGEKLINRTVAKIHETVAEQQNKQNWLFPWVKVSFAAAAVILLFIVFYSPQLYKPANYGEFLATELFELENELEVLTFQPLTLLMTSNGENGEFTIDDLDQEVNDLDILIRESGNL